MSEPNDKRILLAEDDDAMRTYLKRALDNAGYIVDSVDRGTKAVPLLVRYAAHSGDETLQAGAASQLSHMLGEAESKRLIESAKAEKK